MCEQGEKDLKNKNECELFYAIFGHKKLLFVEIFNLQV